MVKLASDNSTSKTAYAAHLGNMLSRKGPPIMSTTQSKQIPTNVKSRYRGIPHHLSKMGDGMLTNNR